MKKGVSTIWIPITSNLWKVQKRDTFFNGSQHNFFPFDISDEGIWQSTLKCWQERVLAFRDVLCDQFFEVQKPEFILNLTEHFSVHTYLWQDSLDCPSRFFCQVLPVKNKYYATDFCYVASHNRLQSFQTTHVKKCRKKLWLFLPSGSSKPSSLIFGNLEFISWPCAALRPQQVRWDAFSWANTLYDDGRPA